MRLSHRIPFNLALNPYYDRLLPRLCQALEARKGSLAVIDVGANIGDTVNLMSEQVKGDFLCIEPEPEFFRYLKKNTEHNSALVCVNVAVGDRREKTKSVQMDTEVSGSAIVIGGAGISLDLLLEEYPLFKQADLLKIDTDGFDFTVIRGATNLLEKNKATLFFEHSPEHCMKVAKENPLDVFGHLSGIGYSQFAFYDSAGHLMAELSVADKGMIEQLLHYAHITGRFYDILSFHDDRAALRADFMKSEHEFFPLFNHAYLDQFSST
jgi:FkbM family methyltransferase